MNTEDEVDFGKGIYGSRAWVKGRSADWWLLLLFRGELPARAATDLAHCSFSGLLAFLAHIETLLGVRNPIKCLLVYGVQKSESC